MAYFVVHALDGPESAEARAKNRPAHRDRLRDHDHPLTVRVGGPLLNDGGEMCGTLLIVEAESRSAVKRFVDGDPYVQAGVYGTLSIHPFAWGLTQLEAGHG